jgi:hypothetical protein
LTPEGFCAQHFPSSGALIIELIMLGALDELTAGSWLKSVAGLRLIMTPPE